MTAGSLKIFKKIKLWRDPQIIYVIWMLGPDLIIWTHALTKRTRERLRSSFLFGSKWVQIIRSGPSIQTTFIFWTWLRFIKHLEFSNKWLEINASDLRSEHDAKSRQLEICHLLIISKHSRLKTLSAMCWFRLISI